MIGERLGRESADPRRKPAPRAAPPVRCPSSRRFPDICRSGRERRRGCGVARATADAGCVGNGESSRAGRRGFEELAQSIDGVGPCVALILNEAGNTPGSWVRRRQAGTPAAGERARWGIRARQKGDHLDFRVDARLHPAKHFQDETIPVKTMEVFVARPEDGGRKPRMPLAPDGAKRARMRAEQFSGWPAEPPPPANQPRAAHRRTSDCTPRCRERPRGRPRIRSAPRHVAQLVASSLLHCLPGRHRPGITYISGIAVAIFDPRQRRWPSVSGIRIVSSDFGGADGAVLPRNQRRVWRNSGSTARQPRQAAALKDSQKRSPRSAADARRRLRVDGLLSDLPGFEREPIKTLCAEQ